MNFSQMHERLRTEMVRRIQRGEASVTLLSKQTGFGRSHVSNFLHSRVRLSVDALDRFLEAQQMTAEDLIGFRPRARSGAGTTMIPVVTPSAALFEPDIRTGGVRAWLSLPDEYLRSLPSRAVASRHSWRRFVAIRVDPEVARSMGREQYAGAIAVIDRHYNSLHLHHPARPNLYVVRGEGAQVVLRYIDRIANQLIVRPANIEFPPSLIEVPPKVNPGEYIAGRVALMLNEV